jgi:sulfite exporter TauE/SafE
MLGCGPLQAMYIMAAGTGSPQEGATMLFFFGLGTLIPLLSFGLIASSVSRDIINLLVRASAILVIAMGLMMADRGLKLTGSGYDFNSLSSRWRHVMPADNHLESNDIVRQR